jgi:hypothetical protein
MLFKEDLKLAVEEHERQAAIDLQMLKVYAGRPYGAEPDFDRVPGRDDYMFIFDGMQLEITGPALREMKEDNINLELMFSYYQVAFTNALRRIRRK